MNATQMDAIKALRSLNGFIGKSQLAVLGTVMRGEEKQHFFDKVVELANIVENMPKTYDQDGMGNKAVAHLHYFTGGCDWYITEKDSTPNEPQHQAFGWADLGFGGELGYISIVELLANGAELDFYFKPLTIGEIKAKEAA
jgi:hypothetical protein